MSAHINSLQEQVNTLYHEMNSLRAQVASGIPLQQHPQHDQPPIDPTLQPASYPPHHPAYPGPQASPGAPIAPMSPSTTRPKSQSQGNHPSFRGPTSNDFSFGVARNSLHTMGITSHSDGELAVGGGPDTIARDHSSNGTPPTHQALNTMHSDKDPIWSVTQEEAMRLCRVYEDEMGLMYPILDIEKVIAYAIKLYRFMEAARRSGLMQQGYPGADAIEDEDTNILKLVLATAMTVEASGRSDLGRRMFEYVQPAIDNSLLGNVGVKGIRLLAMAV